jgi:phosphoribosylformylglycinamidine (FGAM) synthase PurS component
MKNHKINSIETKLLANTVMINMKIIKSSLKK